MDLCRLTVQSLPKTHRPPSIDTACFQTGDTRLSTKRRIMESRSLILTITGAVNQIIQNIYRYPFFRPIFSVKKHVVVIFMMFPSQLSQISSAFSMTWGDDYSWNLRMEFVATWMSQMKRFKTLVSTSWSPMAKRLQTSSANETTKRWHVGDVWMASLEIPHGCLMVTYFNPWEVETDGFNPDLSPVDETDDAWDQNL